MMSPRLRLAILALAFLVFANVAWRVWAGWGLITVDADNAPLAKVIRSIGKQAGITLVANAGPDATVTMHVHKVPLLRALQILAINTGGAWSAGYVVGPDKAAIRGLLDAFATGGDLTAWKKFFLPAGGMPGMGGAIDPREDPWPVTTPAEAKLQAYLEQGAQLVSAQFWTPADWNPAVAKAPASGPPAKVVRRLASAARGQSAEVFFLAKNAGPSGMPGGDAPRGNAPPAGNGGGPPPGGSPDPVVAQAMAKREQARIDRLPPAQRAEAQAKFDERKKFFEEMQNLTPEQRREKMQARIEDDMRTAGPSPGETRMSQMDAMHTAEQRANFFRMVLQHKQQQKQQQSSPQSPGPGR